MSQLRVITMDQFDPAKVEIEASDLEESKVKDQNGKHVSMFKPKIRYVYPDLSKDKLRIVFPPRRIKIKMLKKDAINSSQGFFGDLKLMIEFNSNNPVDKQFLDQWAALMTGLGQGIKTVAYAPTTNIKAKDTMRNWVTKLVGTLVPEITTYEMGAMYQAKPTKKDGSTNPYYVQGSYTLYLPLPYSERFFKAAIPTVDASGNRVYQPISPEQVRNMTSHEFDGQVVVEFYQAKLTSVAASSIPTVSQLYIQSQITQIATSEMDFADTNAIKMTANPDEINKVLAQLNILDQARDAGAQAVTQESSESAETWQGYSGPDIPSPEGQTILTPVPQPQSVTSNYSQPPTTQFQSVPPSYIQQPMTQTMTSAYPSFT